MNPYLALAEDKFWKKAVADKAAADIHPKSDKRFALDESDRIATAGSCFAQNVAKYLRSNGRVQVIESETLRSDDPVFSGRYGNIYTVRQLLQLFDEVQSGAPDPDCAVTRREDGRFVDINRPYMEPAGFDDAAAVIAARAAHIAAIGSIFKDADVFVFTLGLTEGWENSRTGKVYPICPGVYSADTGIDYRFHNFSYEEVLADMQAFIAKLRVVNPDVKVLLTVSPVPLTATFADDDVVTATMHSKSILRAVCGALAAREANVFYFPSYEMIANPFTEGSSYSENQRTVRPDAIEAVMKRFEMDYLDSASGAAAGDFEEVVCDDVKIESSIGF